jgi:hypothetical protein
MFTEASFRQYPNRRVLFLPALLDCTLPVGSGGGTAEWPRELLVIVKQYLGAELIDVWSHVPKKFSLQTLSDCIAFGMAGGPDINMWGRPYYQTMACVSTTAEVIAADLLAATATQLRDFACSTCDQRLSVTSSPPLSGSATAVSPPTQALCVELSERLMALTDEFGREPTIARGVRLATIWRAFMYGVDTTTDSVECSPLSSDEIRICSGGRCIQMNWLKPIDAGNCAVLCCTVPVISNFLCSTSIPPL